jgi:hypothetical protein
MPPFSPFNILILRANFGSHEVKSACQPKGWCTSFCLTSAKVVIFHQKNAEIRKKINVYDYPHLRDRRAESPKALSPGQRPGSG